MTKLPKIDFNISDEEFEEKVLPDVLANEPVCRTYLKLIIISGASITIQDQNIQVDKLTHQECQDICLRIYSTLKVLKNKEERAQNEKRQN